MRKAAHAAVAASSSPKRESVTQVVNTDTRVYSLQHVRARLHALAQAFPRGRRVRRFRVGGAWGGA